MKTKLETKELDLPLLPPFEKEVDVEELAFKELFPHWDSGDVMEYTESAMIKSYVIGYKSAQSKSKQFSLEDIRKAMEYGRYKMKYHTEESHEEFIQSLSTQQLPKEFAPEYEEIPSSLLDVSKLRELALSLYNEPLNKQGEKRTRLVGHSGTPFGFNKWFKAFKVGYKAAQQSNKESELTLREFLSKYSHNNLIRLWFKEKGKSNHVIVGIDSKDASMDHQIIKGKGVFGMYADFKVVELSSILCQGPYPEAVNVVILKEGKKEHHGISIEDDIKVAKKHLGRSFKGVASTELCNNSNNCTKE